MEHDINFDNEILSRECLLIFFSVLPKEKKNVSPLEYKNFRKTNQKFIAESI